MMVVEEFVNLCNLSLMYCINIGDLSVIRISEKLNKLTTLNLSYLRSITDTSILQLVDGCPHFLHLYLSNFNITDISLVRLSERISNLVTSDVSSCKKITDVGLSKL